MACLASSTSDLSGPEPQPRRNLTEAFEELYVSEPPVVAVSTAMTANDATEATASAQPFPNVNTSVNSGKPNDLESPTGVAELPQPQPQPSQQQTQPQNDSYVTLHPLLKRELSQALQDRVSFYAILHDINKEAMSMASNDPDNHEVDSPLVHAATGRTSESTTSSSSCTMACIDEEVWLLSCITNENCTRSCPDTFLEAMGEVEYENPVQSLAGASRTQLWKPSRSWWEAKSGKNPWIEPSLHNKRWRYLWPLIHYHKFLAKCIKKLKRNGVDVKQSVSPVAVFLREDVCAVSDHLAAVSLFDSDEWMQCLPHFDGWLDADAEEGVRARVATLQLRPLAEPGDVDSALLRSQIDQYFLRSMAAARAEKTMEPKQPSKRAPSVASSVPGQPPVYPRQVPRHVSGVRRPRYYPMPPPPHGWYPAYDPAGAPVYPGDNSSVHSGLSLDSYPHHHHHAEYGMPPPYMQQQQQQPPPPYHYPYAPAVDGSQSTGYDYNEYYDPRAGWMDPMAYAMQQQDSGYYAPPEESASAEYSNDSSSPYKYPSNMQPVSPFWAHLDRATLAMGLATPAKASPTTPRRTDHRDDEKSDDEEKEGFAANAQPLLLRPNQYYAYGPYEGQGYGPPSPATQFMMSPQASFAYNYGYGFSPRRPPPSAKRQTPPKERESPATVETTAETESLAA